MSPFPSIALDYPRIVRLHTGIVVVLRPYSIEPVTVLFLPSCSLDSSFLLGTSFFCQKQTASRSGIRVPMGPTDICKWYLRHSTCPMDIQLRFSQGGCGSSRLVSYFTLSPFIPTCPDVGIFEWLWSSNRSVRKVLDFCMPGPLEFPLLGPIPASRGRTNATGPLLQGQDGFRAPFFLHAPPLRLTLASIDGIAIGPASVHEMKDLSED